MYKGPLKVWPDMFLKDTSSTEIDNRMQYILVIAGRINTYQHDHVTILLPTIYHIIVHVFLGAREI